MVIVWGSSHSSPEPEVCFSPAVHQLVDGHRVQLVVHLVGVHLLPVHPTQEVILNSHDHVDAEALDAAEWRHHVPGELLLAQASDDLPSSIVRPEVVVS